MSNCTDIYQRANHSWRNNATFSLHSVSSYIRVATQASMEANGGIECPSSRVQVNNTRKVE